MENPSTEILPLQEFSLKSLLCYYLIKFLSLFFKMSQNKQGLFSQILDWLENKFFLFFGKKNFQPIITQNKENFFKKTSQKNFSFDKEKENEYLISDLEESSLIFWQVNKKTLSFSQKQKVLIFISLLFLIGFGLFTDNLLFSIIAILIGLLFWIFQNEKKGELDTFGITENGVFANDSFYEFSNLKSFWIFLENEENRKELFLENKNLLQKEIRLPIIPQIAQDIRKILLEYLPEEKPEEKVFDYIQNFFDF